MTRTIWATTLRIDLHNQHEEKFCLSKAPSNYDTEQNVTKQVHNGTNSNVTSQDYIMETTEYMEFLYCFTKARWINNVPQTILPRAFEVNFTGSSDGDRRRSLIHPYTFYLLVLQGAKFLTLKTGQSSINDCTPQVRLTYWGTSKCEKENQHQGHPLTVSSKIQ